MYNTCPTMVTDHIFIFFLRSKLTKVFLFFYFFFFFFAPFFLEISQNSIGWQNMSPQDVSLLMQIISSWKQSRSERLRKKLCPSCCFYCSVPQSCLTLCNPMDCSKSGFPVLHHLPEFAHTHVHWVGDAIQLSHPLSSPSPPAFNLSQNQCLFQWIGST